jgi:hypothetical protein
MSKEQSGGAMCGGVINETMFNSNPMAYMMSYIMPDKEFKEYVKLKNEGEDKSAKELFDKTAWSAI